MTKKLQLVQTDIMNKLASHGGIYCLGQLREFRVKGDSPGLGLEKKVTISYEQAWTNFEKVSSPN